MVRALEITPVTEHTTGKGSRHGSYSLLTERSIPTTRNKVRFKPIARRSASVGAATLRQHISVVFFIRVITYFFDPILLFFAHPFGKVP